MMCTDVDVQERCIYWGEGKILCCNKMCEKKIHFCLVWGFSNHLSNEGGKWCVDMYIIIVDHSCIKNSCTFICINDHII